RIKKLNQRAFLDRMRTNEHLAGSLATLEVQTGWRYMTTYLEKFTEVTPEEIQAAAKKYLKTDNKTSVYVIPGGSPGRPPEHYSEVRSVGHSAASMVVKPDISTNNSIYKTPAQWNHPFSFERKPEKIKYPEAEITNVGETTVFYLPDRELPLIDLTLLVKAGAVDVDDGKIGLSKMINGCIIRGGTEKHAPSELARVLDESAIQLSVSVSEEVTVIRLSVMKEDWDKGLALLGEILTRPGFDPEVLNVTRQQTLTSLKRQGGDARAVCRREAKIWYFGDHPYGRDPLQGLETIPDITREDLKAFLKDYFVPSNMVAAVAGDIDKTETVKGLQKLFQALPKEKAPVRKLDAPVETPPVLALINKPGQVQSQIFLSLPSVTRTNPAYWKMSLLMNVFGGSDSLMYTRLRDDLGLIYAGGFFQTYKWKAGMLIGYISCQGDKTAQAISETVNIMTDLRKDVPPKALEQKRLDALNSFVFNVDTPGELVKTYATYHMRKEPLDTLEKIQDAFMSATREELEALARKFVNPQKLQIFVVGDKTTSVKKKDRRDVTLEEDLKALAGELGLPYEEIELR
ncbi:MAG: insulinase family protein, partial [Deltaproteobacteria bacterium]|nr:insulinase family protein [Deltaproteobacteria bacterium]